MSAFVHVSVEESHSGSKSDVCLMFHLLASSPLCRCNCLGDDVIWSRALRNNEPAGSSRSAAEGRASVSTSNLHYRGLYGYGQM